MVNLEKRERKVIILLSALLIAGLGMSAYQKYCSNRTVHIGRFGPDKENIHHAININSADADELSAIKGIGKSLAGRIIEYRSVHGRYISTEDIKNVKGIGPKLYERIRGDITVE